MIVTDWKSSSKVHVPLPAGTPVPPEIVRVSVEWSVSSPGEAALESK